MKLLYIFLLFFLLSCGYPDIDSIPSDNNLILTKEESIDLCKLINTDSKSLFDCIKNINKDKIE